MGPFGGCLSSPPTLGFSVYSFGSFQKPSWAVLKQRPPSDHKTKTVWNLFLEGLLTWKNHYPLPLCWKCPWLIVFSKWQWPKWPGSGAHDLAHRDSAPPFHTPILPPPWIWCLSLLRVGTNWFGAGPVRKQGEKAEGEALLFVPSSPTPLTPGAWPWLRADAVCAQVISQLIKS